jgi:hypothetical protein
MNPSDQNEQHQDLAGELSDEALDRMEAGTFCNNPCRPFSNRSPG